jgi:2-polyprenyl-3-methyl-5-hydroxy-6-metoxy-1,4-benzoquinol methylase
VREAVPDVAGLDILHIQCHIGFDTISLARRGARVTGVDLSPASLAKARALADRRKQMHTGLISCPAWSA